MAFVLYKGIEWRRRLTVTDSDTGARTDLTNRVIKLQLRRHSGQAPIVELTNGSGITLLAQSDSTLGQADVVIDAAVSSSLEVAIHSIDVLLDDQVVLEPTRLPVRAL